VVTGATTVVGRVTVDRVLEIRGLVVENLVEVVELILLVEVVDDGLVVVVEVVVGLVEVVEVVELDLVEVVVVDREVVEVVDDRGIVLVVLGFVEVVVVTAPTMPLVFARVTRVVVDVLFEEVEDARLPMLTVTGVARLPSSSCTFCSCSSAPVAGLDKVVPVPDASFRRQRLCRASCCCCRPLLSSALHAMLASRTSRIDRCRRAIFQHRDFSAAQKRVW
jgi:hypothetical protein